MEDRTQSARERFFEGLGHFGAGRFEAAEASFVASLALLPGRPSTLLNLGATRLALGRPGDALRDLDAALAVEPGDLDARSHRAVALAALGRAEEALAEHDAVLATDPSRVANRLHRAERLHALGRHAEAIAELDRLLALEPGHASAWFRRGQSLQALDRHDEALAAYDRAVAADPAHADAWSQRGGILRDSGRPALAAEAYRQALAHGGDAALNGYYLAAVEAGRDAPPTAPREYVGPLFDDYAESFEHHVVGALRYQGHTVLVGTLPTLGRTHFASALDLGCGTGLCGPLLRTFVDDLEGVDLSPRMLERARALGVYDRLVEADLVEHLRTTERRHDLVVSADVFIYVGDLDGVFAGVRRVTDPGALFCFSLEAADDAVERGYELLPSLRYRHSARYVQALAARHGFEVAHLLPQALREDQRRPVAGLYAYLVRR